MARININLDDVKEYVEAGWYLVRVTGAEIKDTNDGKSQYIRWELEINEPDSVFNGWKVWLNTSLKPTALGMLKRFLKACQFDWEPDGFSTEQVLGAELEVKIENEEYQGKIQNRVNSFRPL